jgi:hypothetical protein
MKHNAFRRALNAHLRENYPFLKVDSPSSIHFRWGYKGKEPLHRISFIADDILITLSNLKIIESHRPFTKVYHSRLDSDFIGVKITIDEYD